VQREEQFFDGLGFWHLIADQEDAGHCLTHSDSLVGKVWYGMTIVCKQNSLLPRCPSQDHGVRRLGEPEVLHAHDVESWQAAKKPSQNVTVKILVTHEVDHGATPSL
jgi:hypothetical protein